MNTDIIKEHINLLGFKVKDRVTGFQGIVTSVSFDLYGCLQVIVTPEHRKEGSNDAKWFDVPRVKVISAKRVMELPNFTEGYIAEGQKGSTEKPANFKHNN